MAQDCLVDEKKIFDKIILVSKFYQDALEQLTQEIATGYYDPKESMIGQLFTNSAYYHHYIEISRRGQADFSAFGTSLEKIEQRWQELNFDSRRDALLTQLGSKEMQRRLAGEIELLVARYMSGVRNMKRNLDEMQTDEYEEYTQDEDSYILLTLSLRDSIDLLLPLLVASEEKATMEQNIEQMDAILRLHGFELLSPLFRIDSVQQMREARFEPREKWWWYLDEM